MLMLVVFVRESCSWVDWLGNVDGSTRYVVTAVDSQGNEVLDGHDSGEPGGVLVGVSFVHQEAPAIAVGQYTIGWNAVVSEPCELDGDGDGYGVGASCLGLDCDDDDGLVWFNLSCVFDGVSCGVYDLCLVSCPVVPEEVCGDSIDQDCDGEDLVCVCAHDADLDCDGVVSVGELEGYIGLWLGGGVSIGEVMGAIGAWAG